MVPKLRFKNAGKGIFPSWLEKTLGDETIWSSGGTPSKQEPSYWNGDISWISASTMRGIKYYDSEFKITEDGLANESKLAPKNSLLLLVRGSMLFNKIPVGLAGRDVAFNQHVKCIKVKAAVKPDFLLYWFFASEHKLLNMVSGTSIGAGKLDTIQLQSMRLLVPSIEEQTKIANFLTAVDDKISQLNKKHQLLSSYKKGVLQKIFSQELRFKDDEGQEFEGWMLGALGNLSDVRDGTHESPSFINIGHPLITSKNLLADGSLDKSTVNFISEEDFNNFNKRSKVSIGDILFGMIGTIGNPVQVKSSNFAIKNVALIKETGTLNNSFLTQYLKSPSIVKKLDALKTGNTQKFISLGNLRSMEIAFPCSTEQTKIANFLSAIDDTITNVKSQLEATKQYKQGLLQQMFV